MFFWYFNTSSPLERSLLDLITLTFSKAEKLKIFGRAVANGAERDAVKASIHEGVHFIRGTDCN